MNIQLILLFQIIFINVYLDQCIAQQIGQTKYFEIKLFPTIIFGNTYVHGHTLELDYLE